MSGPDVTAQWGAKTSAPAASASKDALLRYLLRQIVRSPLKFIFPVEREATPVSVLTVVPEEK